MRFELHTPILLAMPKGFFISLVIQEGCFFLLATRKLLSLIKVAGKMAAKRFDLVA